MISASKLGLRVKQEPGILAVTKLFAANCVILPGRTGCIRIQKSRADVTYWGKWCGDGREIEEEELLEEMGDKVRKVMKNLSLVDREEVESNKG